MGDRAIYPFLSVCSLQVMGDLAIYLLRQTALDLQVKACASCQRAEDCKRCQRFSKVVGVQRAATVVTGLQCLQAEPELSINS
jgi:hypothetical protein